LFTPKSISKHPSKQRDGSRSCLGFALARGMQVWAALQRGWRACSQPDALHPRGHLGTSTSLGDAKSSLGDAKSSLRDVKSLLGDAESSLGDACIAG
jgi:hypothetical protein